jgi:UDP-N-acetylmuramoylalanine--D-glutamate ligase
MTQKMQKLIILGAGESGVGAAILGKEKGYDVFVSDASAIKVSFQKELQAATIEFESGQHTMPRILAADLIIKSPGIPEKTALMKAIREAGIKVISEIEFAGYYSKAKHICITGSNGKTTTTLWCYHILKKAGLSVGLAGNVGQSFAKQVAQEKYD